MSKTFFIIVKAFFIIAITLLFLDFTGGVHTYLGWCAKIQLVPAILAANIAVSLGIILLTLIFGRIYCYMICPLGILQDIVSLKKTFPYRPSRKPLLILRYALLAAFALIAIRDAVFIVPLLEPYSAYGRIASQLLGPVYKWGNNLFAYFAERADSYAFYSVDVWLKGVGPLVVAIITFAVVGVFAWKSGRGYCNTICPVGAFLGLLAKFSVIKPRIDKEKCKHCGICAKSCKAACIDTTRAEIDYLRCITCFKCTKSCPSGAIKYAPPTVADKLTNDGHARRKALAGTATLALGLVTHSHANQFDGGLATLESKKVPERSRPIIPPGAISYKNFHERCTGCQLCVSVCPNQVLRPGGLKSHMSYERGYCRPECVKCSQVCPTGAIRPITKEEKTSIQIGLAVWKQDLCIVNKDKAACDLCARKCPSGAIIMIPQSGEDPASLKIPMIDISHCIGCGACEQLCPARPYSAIYVEGVEVHREI
ncbi:MAG: 4Fe-4S binding protein [Candidatus Fibromonas sp.]|jgi:polyferredoxin|nr:4Fe-4S binding protein [Candidatus Fibromonas sp.]